MKDLVQRLEVCLLTSLCRWITLHMCRECVAVVINKASQEAPWNRADEREDL